MKSSGVNHRSIFSVLAVVFLLTALILPDLACSRKATGWKGRIETEGDVVVVTNPNEPLYGPEVVSLEEDLAIGAGEGEDDLFAAISSIAVADDGTIFVLDSRDDNVKVFDRDGTPVRTIGRSGQGPGEFSSPVSISLTPRGEIMVVDLTRRLEYFKPNGEHIRTQTIASLRPTTALPDSAGNFFVYLIVYDEANPRYELRKVDGDFKDLFEIESSPLPDRDAFNPFFPIVRWAPLSGDRCVCGLAVTYELRIHDASGLVVRKIRRNPDPVPIDQEDVDERTKGTPPDILKTLKVPERYPEFRYIVTDDEDRIWVLTWERPPGRKGFYWDVFDPEGRYLVRTVLPVIQPYFHKGHLYAGEETEDGYPLLKRTKVRWNY
jgi:hypothetical protein